MSERLPDFRVLKQASTGFKNLTQAAREATQNVNRKLHEYFTNYLRVEAEDRWEPKTGEWISYDFNHDTKEFDIHHYSVDLGILKTITTVGGELKW